jgi:hypothetical protein
MEPRKAITTAAVVSLTLLAGAAGIALNSGIVSSEPDSHVGQLTPTDPAAGPNVIDVNPPIRSRVGVRPATSTPVTTSSASGASTQRDDERDEGDHHDEYPGADDDD